VYAESLLSAGSVRAIVAVLQTLCYNHLLRCPVNTHSQQAQANVLNPTNSPASSSA